MKRKIIRVFDVVLIVTMIASICGCSGDGSSNKKSSKKKQTKETVDVVDVSESETEEPETQTSETPTLDTQIPETEDGTDVSDTNQSSGETGGETEAVTEGAVSGISERFTKLSAEDQKFIAENGYLTHHEEVLADSLEWSFDETTGTLNITGNGPMKDYYEADPDWYVYADLIQQVVVSDGITTIGAFAFNSLDNLVHADIPDSVEYIGDYAFYYSSQLDEIPMPASLKEVGMAAFQEVKVHKPLVIPEGVEILQSMAFWANDYWYTINIPASVYYIEEDTFGNSLGVGEFVVDSNNQYYCSVEGVLFDKDMKLLMNYPIMKQEAEYVIPESVTRLGYQAFDINYFLQSLTISSSVEEIGDGNFRCFYGLKEFVVDSQNKSFNLDNGVLLSMDGKTLYAFPKLMKLEEYTIPDGVEIICQEAFSNVVYLKKLVLPEGIKEIKEYAFADMNGTEIVIPDSFTETIEHIECWGFICFTKYDYDNYYESYAYDKENNEVIFNDPIPRVYSSIRYMGSQEQWDAVAAAFNLDFDQATVICEK